MPAITDTVTVTVTWAISRSGDLNIALAPSPAGWDVWAIRTNTHDVVLSRSFSDEVAARTFANGVWATR